MKHKIEIWIRKYSRDLSFYIEDIDNPEKYTFFEPPNIYIEDGCQAEQFKKMFEYLGYEVIIKEVEEED